MSAYSVEERLLERMAETVSSEMVEFYIACAICKKGKDQGARAESTAAFLNFNPQSCSLRQRCERAKKRWAHTIRNIT